jgi:transketolase
MRNTFVEAVLQQFSSCQELFIVSGDAGLGVFDQFQKDHPDRFLNLGVAEQNMAGWAAGLALAGFRVVLYNIIPFVLYRCYEQVRNDICYQRLPVVLAGIGSGVTYAPGGMTHYSVEDLGIARSLPNLEVLSPCDPIEARLAARHALTAPHPVFVRLAKRGEPTLHTTSDFDITRPCVLQQGDDLALVFHGSIGEEVVQAARILRTQYCVSPRVISVPRVQPVPLQPLAQALTGVREVMVIEEHYTDSGLGSVLQAPLNALGWNVHLLGIAPQFIHHVMTAAGLREHFGISAARIAEAACQISNRTERHGSTSRTGHAPAHPHSA